MKNRKKILITGGNGFIGRHLATILINQGNVVYSLDKSGTISAPGVKTYIGDVRDNVAVEKAMKNKDYVYHLAGVLGTSELQKISVEAVEINVIGALNVFDAAVKNKTKVVLISKPNPWLNTYSITKETAEKFFFMYRRDFGIKGVVVKWFSVYGPGQKHYGVQKAVPTFIMAALQNKPLIVYHNGKQSADFIFTDDVVNMTVRLAESSRAEGGVFEAGSGVGTEVNDLAKLIIKLTGSKSKIKYVPMRMGEDLDAKVVANLSPVKKIINFKPKYSLEDGMKKTVEFYIKLSELLKDQKKLDNKKKELYK